MSCRVKLHVDVVCSFCQRVAYQADAPVELMTVNMTSMVNAVEQIRADGVIHGFITVHQGKVVCRECLDHARKTWVNSQEIIRLFGEGK